MFTAIDENNPMTTLRAVKAEYAVFIYEDVIFSCPVTSGPPPCLRRIRMNPKGGKWKKKETHVTITAHRKSARKVGGTMTPLTQNSMRSLRIGMQARIVWKIQ